MKIDFHLKNHPLELILVLQHHILPKILTEYYRVNFKRNTITGNFDTDPNSPQADTQSNHTSPISQQLINHMDMDRKYIFI